MRDRAISACAAGWAWIAAAGVAAIRDPVSAAEAMLDAVTTAIPATAAAAAMIVFGAFSFPSLLSGTLSACAFR
ncbi:hypothetical protein QLQ12_30960 [Actinoplanes sp. NEAU-A12]|uniref:Uncharacterized protein n=1 Tax=Actinoplanes sandaracinus TaxID=3045177 RepID=A0ABT6WTH7_9ACTN|nr:hypothetical protein [Actinoplanes sandaracinus]MDI6103044.1 hypothetical protein [Actinoplanes sandaracinus]